MLHLFLIHLLGVCLLLSQPSRAVKSEEWWNQVVKLCNRELVREVIEVCGEARWARPRRVRETSVASGLSSETMPSFINKDVDTLNKIEYNPHLPQELKATQPERQPRFLDIQQHYQPILKESNPGFEEFKKIVFNRQGEVEDNRPSELKHQDLHTNSFQKMSINPVLSETCCNQGCTRISMRQYC